MRKKYNELTEKEKQHTEKIWKDTKPYLIAMLLYIIILIGILIFANDKLICVGIWILLLGLTMMWNYKRYENWYNSNFDN